MSIRIVFEKYYNGEKNFMTPDVYGYAKRQFGEEYLLFEKSKGRGFENERIYGVSALVYNPTTGYTQKIELSEMYHDPRYVEMHNKVISKSEFKKADRYGEVKEIWAVV